MSLTTKIIIIIIAYFYVQSPEFVTRFKSKRKRGRRAKGRIEDAEGEEGGEGGGGTGGGREKWVLSFGFAPSPVFSYYGRKWLNFLTVLVFILQMRTLKQKMDVTCL